MSEITKKALAASLKKLLSRKPLEKITVVDIVEDCGVNRQTFYYHFKDIYDLVEWIFLSEATRVVGGKKTYADWQQGYRQIFDYVLENKSLIRNAYHSINHEHLVAYLYRITYDLLIGVVNEKAADMRVREEDKAFIADFYKYGFVGLILEWIENGMKEDPEAIVGRLNILIEGDIAKALEKYRIF
jgi:probable dihydroxyacetone kinase regulator